MTLTDLLSRLQTDGPWVMSQRAGVSAIVLPNKTIQYRENGGEVPVLDFANDRDLEQTIGYTLTLAAGGRRVDVSSWEHLPAALEPRPWEIAIGHPKTIHELRVALETAAPWLLHGKATIETVYVPEDVLILAPRRNVGTLFLREAGRPLLGHAIAYDRETYELTVDVEGTGRHGVYVFPVNPQRIPGRDRPPFQLGDEVYLSDVVSPPMATTTSMRAGIAYDSTAIQVIRRLIPPKRRSVYEWLRMPWSERFPE